ncbi:hypothetical protein GGI43DRAFT_408014 [Trichoderma evansii]
MALVTKTGGFYRRIEKGFRFFAILTIVFVLGGYLFFFPSCVFFFPFMHALAFCVCVCYLYLTTPALSPLPPPLYLFSLSLSFLLSISLCFFVVF